MRLHYLQHVPYEGPANIADWADRRGWTITSTPLFDESNLPDLAGDSLPEVDWLVVMGGPMSTCDEAEHPWLLREKQFIERAIAGGKVVIGVCLGAQLIAEVMGAKVYPHKHREIGWFDVERTDDGATSVALGPLPQRFMAFHWHGDTFDIPAGCTHTARSAACANQSFEYDGRVFALQFHVESTAASIDAIINHSDDHRDGAPFVQAESDMRDQLTYLEQVRQTNDAMLDAIAAAHNV